MKTNIKICLMALMLSTLSGNALGGEETWYHTYYGNGAGEPGYDGIRNTFIGVYAGARSKGAGQYNTFLGESAGRNNNGSHNTFLGHQAGFSNYPGSNNNFIGYQAGFSNTDGDNNNFLGFQTGYFNMTGINNNFFGYQAGFFNTIGSSNTFIGTYAGYKNKGSANTFLGNYAGFSNTDGYSNVFLGIHAGYNNTIGHGNVFLGNAAGMNETGSNKLYISNSDTATPLIYGDFSTGTVVIHGKITLQSSREAKDEIEALTVQGALDALEGLRPVTFVYKTDRTERHMGFIAEDVPEPVATKDRKGVNPMDIVTVLAKVIQEQQGQIREQQGHIQRLSQGQEKMVQQQQKMAEQQRDAISAHAEKIAKLERLLAAKKN